MFNKNRTFHKFSDVGMPDIISSIDRVKVSGVCIEKNEDKTAVIDVIVNQEKEGQKD